MDIPTCSWRPGRSHSIRRGHARPEDAALWAGSGEVSALFAEARNEKVVGEASTWYFQSRLAPQLLREFQPLAHIVLMLRDTIAVMQSLHAMRVAMGLEPNEDFGAALASETEADEPRLFTESPFAYRSWARYSDKLLRWLETFGPRHIHG